MTPLLPIVAALLLLIPVLPPGGSYPTCYDAAAVFGGTSPLFGFG